MNFEEFIENCFVAQTQIGFWKYFMYFGREKCFLLALEPGSKMCLFDQAYYLVVQNFQPY